MAAQFYGHTHNDEFKIFYDLVELDRAVNVAFVAPSLTASSDNAGYRVYTIDGPRPGSTWVNDELAFVIEMTIFLIQQLMACLYRLCWITLHGS